jgi:hypothetical protein
MKDPRNARSLRRILVGAGLAALVAAIAACGAGSDQESTPLGDGGAGSEQGSTPPGDSGVSGDGGGHRTGLMDAQTDGVPASDPPAPDSGSTSSDSGKALDSSMPPADPGAGCPAAACGDWPVGPGGSFISCGLCSSSEACVFPDGSVTQGTCTPPTSCAEHPGQCGYVNWPASLYCDCAGGLWCEMEEPDSSIEHSWTCGAVPVDGGVPIVCTSLPDFDVYCPAGDAASYCGTNLPVGDSCTSLPANSLTNVPTGTWCCP